MDEKSAEFLTISEMPNVIGLVDGTHILVRKPAGEEGRLFINRKGTSSLNVQVYKFFKKSKFNFFPI